MFPETSGVFILLGICVCQVSVADESSVRSRCLGLIRTCLNKFQQLQDNSRCRDLQEAVHCLNTDDFIICGASAVTPSPDALNQSNEGLQGEHETNQSKYSDEIHLNQTGHYQSDSHPSRQGNARQNKGSQILRKRQSEGPNLDYMASIAEMTEDAKEEYERKCRIPTYDSSSCQVTWTPGTVLIGFLMACHIVCNIHLMGTNDD